MWKIKYSHGSLTGSVEIRTDKSFFFFCKRKLQKVLGTPVVVQTLFYYRAIAIIGKIEKYFPVP